MWVFELTDDIIGLGKCGDRIVVQDNDTGPYEEALVRPLPFNPGRLLLHLTDGQLTPLSPEGFSALVRLAASQPTPPLRSARSLRRRAAR